MKVFIKIVGICFCLNVFAQPEPDSLTIIYAWKLKNNYSSLLEVPIDTNLLKFQIYNPIYQQSISNSFLSNLGSPLISNVFSDRNYSEDAFFINQYMPYLATSDNTNFYNTKKPFSYLYYTNGSNQQNREESFEVFSTQNITPRLNFGFKYNLISSKGQYKYLNVKKNSFQIFSSFTGKKYMAHVAFNLNRYKNDENGGIIDSVFHANYDFIKQIPTVFNGTNEPYYTSDAQNRVRYYDVLMSQRLKLFTLSSKEDTSSGAKKRNIAEPIVTYVFKLNRATKTYDHDPIASDFYDTIYFNPYRTYDSISDFKITNTLQLEFKTTFRNKVQASVYGLLGNEYETYGLYSEGVDTLGSPYDTTRFNPDTLVNYNNKEKLSNTYFKAGLYTNLWNRVQANFSGTLYLSGQKAGQTSLEGVFNSKLIIFKKEFGFNVMCEVENKIPGYLLKNYHSNHFMWEQSVNPEYRFHLSSEIEAPSNNFGLKGNYYLIRNYIYFNSEAKPVNYNQNLNYFSIEVIKTFRVWKIFSQNELIYQISENKIVLPLPDFVLYNSTYFDHNFRFKKTNGELRTMLGVDIYYNTSFKGYNYSPALAQFCIQDNETIGNYPLMDAFLNIRLKRTRFFFKLQHFNSKWFEQRYYSAVHYPYNQFSFKFGISWIFYN
jgi:hypothetical protein